MTELKKLLDEILSLHRMKSSGVLNIKSEKRYNELIKEILAIGENAETLQDVIKSQKFEIYNQDDEIEKLQKENQELKQKNEKYRELFGEDFLEEKHIDNLKKLISDTRKENEKYKSVIEKIKKLDIDTMPTTSLRQLKQLLKEAGEEE